MLMENTLRTTWSEAKSRARNYKDDESGSLIIFSMFIFFTMIIFSGIAVDMMLYENERTSIQNSTDRAVLAAANLNQTVDPTLVVIDYLAKVGITVDPDDVDVQEVGTAPVITGRQVAVRVNSSYDTILMGMVGVDSLQYAAVSEAEEAINDIEVSLVLDVSGSMGSNDKLPRLQTAAKDFVSGVLAGAVDDRVSLSLVPYSTQVAVGDDLLNLMNISQEHSYSNCANFQNDDMFDSTSINSGTALKQVAAFDPWRSWRYGDASEPLRSEVCRTEPYMDILPWTNEITTVNNQIDDFVAGGNTSIDVAFKWGTALLDPTMNSQLTSLEALPGSSIDEEFTVRPHAHDFDDGLKFIVVMTDGINTNQYYMKDAYKSGFAYRPGRPNSRYYRRVSDNSVWMRAEEPGDRDGDGTSNEPWYNLSERKWDFFFLDPEDDDSDATFSEVLLQGSDADDYVTIVQRLDWLDLWPRLTVSRYAYAEYHQTWDSDDYWDNRYEPYDYVNATDKDTRLGNVCTAAKDAGIIVFTIGFEVTDHSAGVMRSCASTPNHFYRVEGLDIEYAFASIKNQINQLKLTQ